MFKKFKPSGNKSKTSVLDSDPKNINKKFPPQNEINKVDAIINNDIDEITSIKQDVNNIISNQLLILASQIQQNESQQNILDSAENSEYFGCLDPKDNIIEQIFNDATSVDNTRTLNEPGDFHSSSDIPNSNVVILDPKTSSAEFDNVSIFSNATSTYSISKRSQKSQFRKAAQNPEIIEEGINPFHLPLRELITKIPSTNPLVKNESSSITNRIKYENIIKSEIDKNKDVEDNQGPQVCIDADGNMVINESSLFIKPKSDVKLNNYVEFEDEETHHSYSKRATLKKHKWLPYETKKFYISLQMVGLDFYLIAKLLKSKTRKQCLSKYKKEYKLNPELVNSYLKKTIPYDLEMLDSLETTLDSLPKKSKKQVKSRATKKSYET